MPSIKFGLDLDTRKFTDPVGNFISSLTGKKGMIADYQLQYIQNSNAVAFPDGSSLDVALKQTTLPAGQYLFETTGTSSGWGTGFRWYFRLDLTGDPFNDVIGKTVDFEVAVTLPDGQRIPSVTLPFIVQKHVIVP